MKASDKIKATIMALLAKASGTDNEHEAEAFLAKAHAMLEQYQLDVADLVGADDPIIQHFGYRQAEGGHAWKWKLYCAVGALYGARSAYCFDGYDANGRGGRAPMWRVELVGRESAVITAELMYPWIVAQVKQHAKALSAITGMSEQGQAKRVAAALISRIWRLVVENKASAPATAAGRNALVILDQVEAKFLALYPDLAPARTSRGVSDSLSRAAAGSIGLHRQASSASTLKLGSK